MSGRRSRAADGGGTIPIDLIVVLAYVALVSGLYVSNSLGPPADPVRVLLTLPVLFFLPGYALAAAAFPRAPAPPQRRDDASLLDRVQEPAAGVDTVERAALGFGLSIALLPIVGLAVAAPIGPVTALGSLTVLTALAALFSVIAAVRRWQLAPEDRYRLPIGAAFDRARAGSAVDTVLSVVLALAVVAAVGAGALALAAPQDGTQYTGLGIGTINESDEFVNDGYPTDWESGESASLAFQVRNYEDRTVDYTVVVQMQRIGEDDRIVETTELERYNESVPPGAAWTQQHTLTPALQGDRLQVVYLLYKGDPPATPTRSNADRYVFFWTEVGGDSGRLAAPN